MNIKELFKKGMKYADWLDPNKVNVHIEETKRKACLITEMSNFRDLFKIGTIMDNPYKYRLKQMFDKGIDECNKYDLLCLGFNSNLFHAKDFQEQ